MPPTRLSRKTTSLDLSTQHYFNEMPRSYLTSLIFTTWSKTNRRFRPSCCFLTHRFSKKTNLSLGYISAHQYYASFRLQLKGQIKEVRGRTGHVRKYTLLLVERHFNLAEISCSSQGLLGNNALKYFLQKRSCRNKKTLTLCERGRR